MQFKSILFAGPHPSPFLPVTSMFGTDGDERGYRGEWRDGGSEEVGGGEEGREEGTL